MVFLFDLVLSVQNPRAADTGSNTCHTEAVVVVVVAGQQVEVWGACAIVDPNGKCPARRACMFPWCMKTCGGYLGDSGAYCVLLLLLAQGSVPGPAWLLSPAWLGLACVAHLASVAGLASVPAWFL